MKDIKSEYCSDRDFEYSRCENFVNDECVLLQEHIEILQSVNDRKKLIKKDKS